MAQEPSAGENGEEKRIFSAADRIAQLNDIDRSVASLLRSAGSAISILANEPASSNSTSLSTQQTAFTTHASSYFATLSTIDVRLRRQVYALEEAGLIRPGDERDVKRGRTLGGDDMSRVSGNGALDTSWLNARASENVEQGMEKEIWATGRQVVELLQTQSKDDIPTQVPTIDTKGSQDESMEIDTDNA